MLYTLVVVNSFQISIFDFQATARHFVNTLIVPL